MFLRLVSIEEINFVLFYYIYWCSQQRNNNYKTRAFLSYDLDY